MSDVAKQFLVGLFAIGMVTTMVLPRRQTVGVINALTGLVTRSFGTVMGLDRSIPR